MADELTPEEQERVREAMRLLAGRRKPRSAEQQSASARALAASMTPEQRAERARLAGLARQAKRRAKE